MSVAIGALGRAVTPLSPNGTVEIDGQSHSARCVRKLIPDGTRVVVVGRDETGLLVREASGVDRDALPGAGTVAQAPTEKKEYVEELGRMTERDHTIQLVFFFVLMSIFPIVGFISYGVPGIGIGLLADVVLGFLYAGYIGF